MLEKVPAPAWFFQPPVGHARYIIFDIRQSRISRRDQKGITCVLLFSDPESDIDCLKSQWDKLADVDWAQHFPSSTKDICRILVWGF